MAGMRAVDPRVSYAELARWPDDGRRYELYDGEAIVAAWRESGGVCAVGYQWRSLALIGRVRDGKVYIGDEDGDVVVLEAAKEKKLISQIPMGSSVYATVVPANGTLFLGVNDDHMPDNSGNYVVKVWEP